MLDLTYRYLKYGLQFISLWFALLQNVVFYTTKECDLIDLFVLVYYILD